MTEKLAIVFYIGRLPHGNLAMAAIGICVPLTTIINTFNGLFRRGGAPLSSIRLGEENEAADHILSNSFISSIISSFVITFIVLVFQEPILYLFGASQETLSHAKNYIVIYALGIVFATEGLLAISFNSAAFKIWWKSCNEFMTS